MKKIMKLFVYVAAAAMTLASCQKNEMDAPVKKNVHFTIKAGIETKTYIEETPAGDKTIYTPKWDGDEVLGVLFAAPNNDTNREHVVKLPNTVSGSHANFEGDVEIEGESGTFYSFYPAEAFERGYTEGDVRLDLSNVQKPTATSFDPDCDILVAKPQDYVVEEGVVTVKNLEFARIMSVLRIDLKSEFQDLQNEFVKSISFTAGDIEITGYARIKLDNPEFTGNWASSGNQYCTVTANYDTDIVSINGESNSVYLVIAPVTIPAGKDLTFEIRTKNYSLTKKITSPEMKFTAGNVSKINLSISSENIDQSDDYSGKYLIAGKEGDKWYAAKKYSTGNYLTASEIEFEGENILETENIADYYMTIDKVVGGDYDGMYTIVDAGGKYLSTSSSSSNDMKAVDAASVNTYWTIKKDDDNGTYSIVASMSGHRNDMRFNYNNGNPRVSCYDGTKTNLPYLTLFSTSLVKPDTTPKLDVKLEQLALTFEAADGEIDVTAKNLSSDPQVRALTAEGAQEVVDWLTVTYANGKITYTATANESEDERTAYIEAYVSDDLKDGVAVTQAGKPAEGGEPVEVTIVASELGYSNSADVTDVMNGLLIFAKNTGQNSPKYYGSGTNIRMYDKNTLTVTAPNGGILTSIAFTVTGSYFNLTTAVGTISNKTWTGNTESVTFTNGSDQTRITKIVVTYQKTAGDPEQPGEGGGETPEPEPDQPGQGGGDEKVPSTTACYVLDGTKTGGTNGYAAESEIKQGDITWGVEGNTTESPWRIGGKSITNVDRNVCTKTAYSSELSKIEFISGTLNVTSWNSLTLVYSTNSDFSNSQTMVASSIGATKTITFSPEGGFPANCYYKFILNITVSGGNNKYVQLKGIKFYGYEN